MRKQTVLIAAHQLNGGTTSKQGKVTPHTTAIGTEIDQDEAAKLGLSEKDIAGLMDRGFIVQQQVRTAGDSLADDGVVDGITVDEFRHFLSGHGILFPLDASAEGLLALEPVAFHGVELAALGTYLDLHNVSHSPEASAEEMLEALLLHQPSAKPADDPLAAIAASIDETMDAKAIKAELGKLEVPFEANADKHSLARLLAQARQPAAG